MLFPMETNCENPILPSMAQSRTDVQRAPDCEINAIFPGFGISAAKLALSFSPGTIDSGFLIGFRVQRLRTPHCKETNHLCSVISLDLWVEIFKCI